MSLITVIGRGHSGTRAISRTLSASGVFMGKRLNASGDLLPPDEMYEACRVLGPCVQWLGDDRWDWSALHTMDIPAEFTRRIHSYLDSVLSSTAEHRGWKIPETTLVFPWIMRMFPEAKYIFWIRDPRDCILRQHLTDDLRTFGVPAPAHDDVRLQRAISWKYQYDIVKSTLREAGRPANWLEVRFEDFVLRQAETLTRLEEFLGLALARIPVNSKAVGRFRGDTRIHDLRLLESAMREYGYEPPPR